MITPNTPDTDTPAPELLSSGGSFGGPDDPDSRGSVHFGVLLMFAALAVVGAFSLIRHAHGWSSFAAFPLGIVGVWFWQRALRRGWARLLALRRQFLGLCPHCGQGISGGRCPECGGAVL